MKRIIFIYPQKASYIDMDIAILSERYTVIENTYNWKNKIAIPFTFLRHLIFILRKIKSADYLIVSFGGYWALLPTIMGKIFKKPIFIILNGTDCASFAEINYGSIRNPLLKQVLKVSYTMASHLLPVSRSLIYNENTYFSREKSIKQGYKHFFKNNKTRTTVIFNAIDSNQWRIMPDQSRKNNRLLTVLSNQSHFILKGGELILAVAGSLPQFEFYFVGIQQPEFSFEIPANVKFIPRTPPDQLLKIYNSTKYYLQLSILEGFGCALCESMLCGCIPIVSRVNMLPEIIGVTGYVLDYMETNLLINLLIKIEKEDNENMGEKARKRIIENYSVKKRQEQLYQVIENEN